MCIENNNFGFSGITQVSMINILHVILRFNIVSSNLELQMFIKFNAGLISI